MSAILEDAQTWLAQRQQAREVAGATTGYVPPQTREEAGATTGYVPPQTREEELIRDLHAALVDARAILEGRTTPPTLREIAAHPGEWLVDGNVVVLYFYDDHDTYLRLHTSNTALGDSAARAWLAESASECRRWVAIDAEGRPCAWPKVSP